MSTPLLVSMGQARDSDGAQIVVATVRPPDISAVAVTTFRLYRATTIGGSYSLIDTRLISPYSRYQNLFDESPLWGQKAFYKALVDDGSATDIQSFTGMLTPKNPGVATGISAGAYGSYPLLGSDVYLDPATGEGVVGPNGDLLGVNGLALLAQDLRTRFITDQGELLLHPEFGMTKTRIIGSGQSNPTAEALFLQTKIVDACTADPRVDSVAEVIIRRESVSAWTVELTIIAIGIEDPQRLNIVFPYFTQ